MTILFPSEPFSENRQIDSSFEAEKNAAILAGFDVCLFDHDEFVRSAKFNPVLKSHSEEQSIILRSWMLKEGQYSDLYDKLLGRGYRLINTPEQYLNCHHYPNVHKHVHEYAAKAWWSNTWSEHPDAKDVQNVSWSPIRSLLGDGDILIKDYVKSEKDNPDLFILKKELSNEEFGERVERFIKARGKLFNKGLVFKQVEPLKKYEGHTNEWRLFFINKKVITFGINIKDEFKAAMANMDLFFRVNEIAREIDSNFFTIDIAEKEDGSWMILEAGDGQVSGLAAQEEPIRFYNNLYNALHGITQ